MPSPEAQNPTLSQSDLTLTTNEDTAIVIDLSPAAAADVVLTVAQPPAHGQLGEVQGHTVTYTPNANFAGADSFVFVASRGDERAQATASITVTAIDDPPTPVNDALVVARWESTSALTGGATSVLANDADIDGGPAPTATLVSAPAHGLVTLNLDGTFTYLNNGDAASSDAFTYAVGPASQATVTITVTPATPFGVANLNFNGSVLAAAHQGDAWFVGGLFTLADMLPARRLVAVTLSGQPTGCNVEEGFDNAVNSVVVIQNAIYAGGHFQTYRGQPASYLAKIDMTTCELDATFSPPANNGFDDYVRKLATDGTALYAIGPFNAYRGAPAHRFAKIATTTGNLDDAFMNPVGVTINGFDGEAYDLRATATDVFVAGSFSGYRGIGNTARAIAHISTATGDLIPSFGPPGPSNGLNYSNSVGIATALAYDAVNEILYAAGSFTEYRNASSLTAVNGLARINLETGTASTTFSPPGGNGFDNTANVLELADGALFVGGAFDVYRGSLSAHRIAKLDPLTGNLDTTFSPQVAGPNNNGFEGNITAIVGIGGAILVGGQPLGGYRSATDLTTGLAKLSTSTGDLDPDFLRPTGHDHAGFPDATFSIRTAQVAGSTIWLGGSFLHVGGRNANRIARIKDADGSFDQSFSPSLANGFDADVYALAATNDALFVGGNFTQYRGQPGSASRLAKLNPTTGALDTTFGPPGPTANGFNGRVEALLYDAGVLYVGGGFSAYRGVANSAFNIAKLNADNGQQDTVFSPVGAGLNGFDDDVVTFAKRDNELFVGGDFVQYRGGSDNSNYIAKLDATTGALSTTFSPPLSNGFDSSVAAIARIGDSLYVGGSFQDYRSTTQVGNFVKLSANDGTLDTSFATPGATAGFDDDVSAITTSGGALYVGGRFFSYRGVPGSANFLAKVDPATGALDATFTPSGATSGYGFVQSLATYRDLIFAGGQFTACDHGHCFANGERFDRVNRTFK